MNRRDTLVALLAFGLAPPTVLAQPTGKVWRIGLIFETVPTVYVGRIEAFKAGMRELGYTEGRDYVIEQRSAQNELTRFSALAAELVALKVDFIVTSGTPSALAARNATKEIPILLTTTSDAIASGLAASLRRPGGNVTGLVSLSSELYTKRLDLLMQIVPGLQRVGFMYNPDNPADLQGLDTFEADCTKLNIKSIRAPLRKREDIETAFSSLRRDRVQALVVTSSSTIFIWDKAIQEYAAKLRLPAMYGARAQIESGGLISYSPDRVDLYRRAASYAGKIIEGAKPGDLPIELPTKYELVINLKTARALGITVPQSLLVRADEVIP